MINQKGFRRSLYLTADTIIIVELFLVLGINISIIFQYGTITSLLFAVSTLILIVYFVLWAKIFNNTLHIFVIVSTITVLFNALLYNANIFNFDYYRKLILLISAVIFFCLVSSIPISLFYVKVIKCFTSLLSVIYICSYYIIGINTSIANGITLNYTNPNLAGMWLAATALLNCYFFFESKKNISKCFFAICTVLILNLLYLTLCRGAIISIILAAILFLMQLVKREYGLSKKAILMMLLLPLVFGVFYLSFITNERVTEMFSFLVTEGKTLTSRVTIWKHAFDVFLSNPLFGNYYTLTGGTGLSQMHNSHIDVIATYGLVVFCLFIKLIYKCLITVKNDMNCLLQCLALCGFLGCIFIGTFEAALVSGGIGLNYVMGCFIYLMKYNPDDGRGVK